MSRRLCDGHTIIDKPNECKYMYNRICCLGDSSYCGEYPQKDNFNGCNECDKFEIEDLREDGK